MFKPDFVKTHTDVLIWLMCHGEVSFPDPLENEFTMLHWLTQDDGFEDIHLLYASGMVIASVYRMDKKLLLGICLSEDVELLTRKPQAI